MAGGFPVGYPFYGRLPVEPGGRIEVPENSLPPWERRGEPVATVPSVPPPIYGPGVLPPPGRFVLGTPFFPAFSGGFNQNIPWARRPRKKGAGSVYGTPFEPTPPDILERGPSVR